MQVAVDIAERIRMEVEKIDWQVGRALSADPRHGITISCGIAEYNDEDSLDTLLQRADKALYKIKRQGGNGVLT